MKNILLNTVLALTLISGNLVAPVQARTNTNCASAEATKVEAVTDANGITTYQDNFSAEYYNTNGHSNAVPQSDFSNADWQIAGNAMRVEPNNPNTVATNPVGRWATSGVWTNNGTYNKVQIPLTVNSDGFKIKSYSPKGTAAINLELANANIKKLHNIHLKSKTGSRSVRFLVNGAEDSFYEIGLMDSDRDTTDYITGAMLPKISVPSGKKLARPYFRKVVGGAEAALSMDNVTVVSNQRILWNGTADGEFTLQTVPTDADVTNPTKALYISDYWCTDNSVITPILSQQWTEFNVSIDYASNEIALCFSSALWGGMEFKYKDAELAAMLQSAYYPVALTSSNDGCAQIDSFKVSYEAEKDYDYCEDFSYTGTQYVGTKVASVVLNEKNTDHYIAKDVTETAEDGTETVVTQNVGAAYTGDKQDILLMENNGAKYIYSGLFGLNSELQHTYAGFIKNTNLTIADRYNKNSTVHLDISGTGNNIQKLSKIYVRKTGSNGIGNGVKFLLDDTQKTYYIVGVFHQNWDTMTPTTAVTANKPFLAKMQAGKCVQMVQADAALTTTQEYNKISLIMQAQTEYDIDIGYTDITVKVSFANGQVMTMTLSDDSLISMRKKAAYPVGVEACGDGYVQYDKIAMNFDGFTVIPEPGYSFVDRFNLYNNGENGVGTAENEVHSTPGAARIVAAADGHKWMLSGNVYGYHKDNKEYSKAYVNYSTEKIGISDFYQAGTAVNLDLDNEIEWVDKIEFSSEAGGSRRGIRALVSDYEDTYWEFCIARAYDTNLEGVPYTGNQPYVRRVQNGVVLNEWLYTTKELEVTEETVTGADGKETIKKTYTLLSDGTQFKSEDWVITFADDGTVAWTVTDKTDSSITWSGSYVDAGLDSMMNNVAYPVSLYALGDGYSFYDDVKLSYAEGVSLITDKVEGGHTVSIQPAAYRRFLPADQKYVTVIAAYYAADGSLITAESVKIDDMTNLTQYDIADKTEKGAARGKLFVWGGNITGAKRLISQEF